MSKKTRTKRPNNNGDQLEVRVYHPVPGDARATRDGKLYENQDGRFVRVARVPIKKGRT